jgi:hypothetical protein
MPPAIPPGPGQPPGGGGGTGPGPGGAPPPAPAPVPEEAPVTGTIASQPAASTRFARLSHKQWVATVRDLLRLPPQNTVVGELAAGFVAEPGHLSTFDNNGEVREVSKQMWGGYQAAAEALARLVSRDARLLAAILPPGLPSDPAARARAFVTGFGLRAHRRPLADAEVTQYLALFNQGARLFASGDAFADGVQITLQALLQSPHLLYRTELGGAVVGGRVALDDYEVASRLSYGLTGSMPDDALLAEAGARRLRTPAEVRAQALRLLGTPAARATLRDFHEQLLHTGEYDSVKRDEQLHPTFRGVTGQDLAEESLAFVQDVIFERGKGVGDLLTAPYTFANARLAAVYGVPAPAAGQGDRFARVDLDPTQRAGLLTQLGFLAANATDRNPRSIMRGVFVSDRILCVALPSPPNMPPETTPAPARTNRQVLEELTQKGECAVCHAELINPLGFAFESYDPAGRFRTTDNGLPVDASGSYAFAEGRRSFTGAVELARLIGASRQAHDCYARHLMEFVYGRELAPTGPDTALVTEAGRRSKREVAIRALVADLVATDAFLYRLP